MIQLADTVRRSQRSTRLAACAVLVALAALMLAWSGRAGAGEERSRGPAAVSKAFSNVAVGKADAVDATDLACTGSEFTDMPGMSEAFSFGGTIPRPVIVLFQGAWSPQPGLNLVELRLTIDGIVQSGPQLVAVDHLPSGEPAVFETHGFNFISDPVAPGLHVARIQYRGLGAGACIEDRSLIVLHK